MIINDTSNGKFYKNSKEFYESEEKSVIINDEGKDFDFADQINNLNEEDFDDSLEQLDEPIPLG